MRKIIASMNITLDGFAAGNNGEMDWHFSCWNEEMERNLYGFLHSINTGLIGRVTYEAMSHYWPAAELDPTATNSEIGLAKHMNSMEKIVFSATLRNPKWSNTRLLRSIEHEAIDALKAENGTDMVLMGTTLIQSFMQLGLVDEYRLMMHPVILGSGIPLFSHHNGWLNLDLLESKTFSNGVLALRFSNKRKYCHHGRSI
ncbi:dihydrofolate reductase family protein [Flavihumibacter petaseus]|uniref:Bacterial bifunctional deaminase-reductase C-terminal domain-containing protein n=1 Tax=Flavihumibacter petaseus NBRC 106054 TaxID=1220578 RepID=A0A0E9MV95_9BACT|nr:dihydrofolate reductase family protein [Flavihumibacter petaseus]GAO41050.1 hypothetical protein FPE01S_01_00620 [Flavihumibacter petaseus NBRC 106054]